MVNNRIFDDMPQMAVAHAAIVKRNAAKTVFIPHFHAVVAADALRDNRLPDIQLWQQLFAAGINGGYAQRRRRIGGQRLRQRLFQHGNPQAAAL